jgi:hypothetical protein
MLHEAGDTCATMKEFLRMMLMFYVPTYYRVKASQVHSRIHSDVALALALQRV